MKKYFKPALILAFTILGFSAAFNPAAVFAEETDCNDTSIPEIVRESAGCDVGNTDQFQPVIVNILNGIIGICGLIAVVYIVIGGINYMTSAGDAGKIKKARDTILYAVIGLIVVALAFALVNFVIVKVIYN